MLCHSGFLSVGKKYEPSFSRRYRRIHLLLQIVYKCHVLQVYSWGSNMCGQLGHVNSPVTVPQQAKVHSEKKTKHVFYCPFKHVAVTLTDVHLSMCSSLMVSGFGTCLLVRATPSSWLMETVCSLCCCTVVSSRSQDQHRARGPVKVRGHPVERRAIQSDPLCCPSAQRFVWNTEPGFL